MKKKIILRPTTFLWTTAEEGLLYNTKNGSYHKFVLQDPSIRDACSQWQEMDNLYTAHFEDALVGEAFLSFVNVVAEKELGKVYDEKERVMAIPPILKVKEGVDFQDFFEDHLHSMPVLDNLIAVMAFLGGHTDACDWWRQVMYPMDSEKHLEAARLLDFLSRCDSQSLLHLHLIISDWDETQMDELARGLVDWKEKVRFFFAHPDPGFRNSILNGLVAEGYAITQVCPPQSALTVPVWNSDRKYQLLVRSEAEFNRWQDLLKTGTEVDSDFLPIADDNLEFFRANVFLSEEEILGQKLSKKAIFRHQALNVNLFGTFYVFPDGSVHPSVNAPAVGTLDDSVYQSIIRELEENHAWRQTRREMEPCKDCLFKDLCPSPSAYELVLGAPACTVFQTTEKRL